MTPDSTLPETSEPLFDAEHAAFMQCGVSLSIGTCDAGKSPSTVRAVACRVRSDCLRVTMLVPGSKAADVIADVRGNGAIAVAFSQPSTNRTLQIKGRDAVVEEPAPGDMDVVRHHLQAFIEELRPLGFQPDAIRNLLACSPEDLVALSFTPAAAFSQTPGPNAGEPLKVRR